MTDSNKNKHNSYVPVETKLEKYRDWLILSCILVIGMGGLFFISYNPIQKSKNDADKGKLISHFFGKKSSLTKNVVAIRSNNLKINGTLKANELVDFELQNRTEKAEYTLVLGDSQSKAFESDQISHKFNKAGIYKIELRQKLGDQVSIIHSEYLELL